MIQRVGRGRRRDGVRWSSLAMNCSGPDPGGDGFEDLVALAAFVALAPFAVLHIDEPPAWLAVGTDTELLPAPHGWPGIPEAIQSTAFVVSANTVGDPRFAGHPMVTGTPHIRSLVVMPLINEAGVVLGALGVFDTLERTAAPIPIDPLLRVARSVVRQAHPGGLVEAVIPDVPERPLTDSAVSERHRLLDGILVHTDALIYAKDLDGRFLYLNPALADSFAFPPDMLGRTDHDLFPDEQADSFRRNDQRIIRTGTPEVFEEVLTHADGSVHSYRSTKFPVRDETGQTYAVAGVSVDVSELTSARQAHQQAEQRWHALVEHSSVGVVLVGPGRVFRYANRQAAALFGVGNRRSLIGRIVDEFMPDEADPASMSRLLDTVLNGAPPLTSRRGVLKTVGGTEVLVEFSAATIVDRGDQAVQVEIRDVTAAVAAEERLQASERRFRAVFDNSPVAMGIADGAGHWVATNEALERMLGVGPGDLLGAVGRDFVHPDDQPMIDAARNRQLGTDGELPGMEVRFVRADGELRWAWISLTVAPGLGGEKWVLGISKDVTNRKATETALLESQQDLAAIAAVAKCVQSGADPRPLVVESIQRLSGASSVVLTEALDDDTLVVTASAGNDIVGVRVPLQEPSMTAQVWGNAQRVFLADVAASTAVNPALLKMNTVASSLWQPVVVRGTVQAVIGVGWPYKIDDPGDRAIRAVQLIADEVGASLQASRLHRELEKLATTDPLTGTLNRRAWDRSLQRLMDIAQLTGEPLAIAMLDLDHFKTFNDRFGHTAGDVLLAEFANAARSCLRKNDVLARWGGEEFVVALPDCSSAHAARILERILDRIQAASPARLTCSIGHTTWIPGEDLTTCISRADSALYIAKNTGRNRIITA